MWKKDRSLDCRGDNDKMTDIGKKKGFQRFRVEQIVAGSFGMIILLGFLLLLLPVSHAPGETTHWTDALFTAVSAVCVTGLVTVPTAIHWSVFGQCVILVLIQLGGLGIMACAAGTLLLLRRRMSMHTRRLIAENYNLDTMNGLTGVVRKIVGGTLLVEALGTIPYAVIFIPEYGFASGLFKAVFNAVSCFCNAGMDILGEDSLVPYVTNPVININTILLIVVGGIGFFVWFDLMDTAKHSRGQKKGAKSFFQKLSLHTRMALVVTAVLIVTGTVLIACFEWNNPQTLGTLSVPDKIMAALFQSVTTRTAGFQTMPQENFTDASGFISLLLMFIGGSPMGTAGGMKTTTIAVIFLTMIAYLRGRDATELYNRRLRASDVRSAMVVLALGFSVAFTGTVLLSLVTDAGAMDVLYEVVSAVGTVGLTRGLTPMLNTAGKLIIMVIMYCGRIGPVTLAMAITVRMNAAKKQIRFPEEKIMIG